MVCVRRLAELDEDETGGRKYGLRLLVSLLFCSFLPSSAKAGQRKLWCLAASKPQIATKRTPAAFVGIRPVVPPLPPNCSLVRPSESRQNMAAYRVYQASYVFEARDASELTIEEGDEVLVHQTAPGAWPASRWVNGTNRRTGLKGDFPGNYCELVEEVNPPPLPISQQRLPSLPAEDGEENAPPVPPRKASGTYAEWEMAREGERW